MNENDEEYGDRFYRRMLPFDRMYADRLLIIDYRLLYSTKQELKHITFLGPLIDRTEDISGYRTIILIRNNDDREEAAKRIEELCFQAEIKTLDEISNIKKYSTNAGIICSKMRYESLKKKLVGNFYVFMG